MEDFLNKLNPLPVALSRLSLLDSDDVLRIVQSAGVLIDLNLTKEEGYSNKTRKRVYLPRINDFIKRLDDSHALRAIYLIFQEILEIEENQTEIRESLQKIGWDLINNTIAPIDAEVIELYFEKGLVHSAYQKIREIIHKAVKEIYIIDPYIDSSIFELFKCFQNESLLIKILTCTKPADYEHEKSLFLHQYSNLTINEKVTKDFHDRFIITNKKEVYHLGASIKDAGKKVFMINKIEDEDVCHDILDSFNKRWL